MSDPIRLLIADDHEVVRQGLRAILEQEPGLIVVGEAADGESALGLSLIHISEPTRPY